MTATFLQLHSLVREDGNLQLSLEEQAMPVPGPNEVVVKIDAAPINPSDLALMNAFADVSKATQSGSIERPVITAPIAPGAMAILKGRIGESLPVGNEGAGEVVAAGESEAAQAMIGKIVGFFGGETFGQYRCINLMQCLPLEEGTTAVQGASCFVNPMTVLGMIETMRSEGHSAIVHTASASNLGQMMNRICLDEGIPLVNIVRRQEQVAMLKEQGAKVVLNSSDADYRQQLLAAIAETGATLAYDPIGGGDQASVVLSTMEAVEVAKLTAYDRYGSSTHKQLYVYGLLDRGPIVLNWAFGFAWGIGGWLLTHFLQRAGVEKVMQMQARVAREIHTTFASHYTAEVSLAEMLKVETLQAYSRQATGEKYLIRPHQ